MKKKLITVTSAALLAAALACPAWAEEMPVDRATPSKATVAAQVDTATNSKPSMGTQYWMYLEPDAVVNDIPKMGDEGLSTEMLLAAALIAGAVYVGACCYADLRG